PWRDRRVFTDIVRRPLANHAIQKFGRQSETWPNAPYRVSSNQLSCPQCANEIERAPEHQVTLLTRLARVVHIAQRRPGCLTVTAKSLQFMRFQRKAIVRPATTAVQREVL